MNVESLAPQPSRPVAWLFKIDLLASLLSVVWGIFFIVQNSFVAIDGQRYFSLFEDAMISMRYAWNFSHGLGLVWNAGERVEGYTNLLMTLIMSLATALFDKKMAVLAIHLLGIPTVLGIAFCARRLAAKFHPENALLANLVFIGSLFYLPISYWSLLGMETGLLTLLLLAGFLCAVQWLETRQSRQLLFSATLFGLAFLTRNESLLLTVFVFGYLAFHAWRSNEKKAAFSALIGAILIYGLFVAGQQVFRLVYYGQLVPNTYTLKVTGIPLSLKLRWGLVYIWPFLLQSWPLFGLALIGTWRSKFKDAVLAAFVLILLAYQVSVGGDTFSLWRIMSPGIPFLFIPTAAGIIALFEGFVRRLQTLRAPALVSGLSLALLLLLLTLVNVPLLPQVYTSFGQPYPAYDNEHSVNLAIGINALTKPGASIGVFLAGTLPYYSDRKAIDFLGKSDTYIANLPPHLDISLPGHNKFDLGYSIKKLQPTYIQRYYWWDKKENLRPWAVKHYVRVNYVTPRGEITLILKRNDPLVNWDKGTIIPWAEETGPPSPASTTAPLAATATPTKAGFACTEPGIIGADHVPRPTQGFSISFSYYLPPCYDSQPQRSYPTLYLLTLSREERLSLTDNTPMSLAERLIHSGKLPPVIIITPGQLIGYGSDAAMAKDLLPYVDGKFRTLRDREHRGAGGISNGAAIAVRMAFQFPELFSRVGLLSGGLADGEGERFDGWLTRTEPERWPRVRIDVGDRDAIMPLTQNLLAALDKRHVPYSLNVAGGDHDWTFWSARMETYFLWLTDGW